MLPRRINGSTDLQLLAQSFLRRRFFARLPRGSYCFCGFRTRREYTWPKKQDLGIVRCCTYRSRSSPHIVYIFEHDAKRTGIIIARN